MYGTLAKTTFQCWKNLTFPAAKPSSGASTFHLNEFPMFQISWMTFTASSNVTSWMIVANGHFQRRAVGEGSPGPPFDIELEWVQAGPRLGWAWGFHKYIGDGDDSPFDSCEINWLDPEPDRNSNDYEIYIQELQAIQGGNDFFNLQIKHLRSTFSKGTTSLPRKQSINDCPGAGAGNTMPIKSLGHGHRYTCTKSL